MCGIVGYVGHRECVDILIDGLKRMEYRGYDSAGVALINGHGLEVHKNAGKISVLQGILRKEKPKGSTGIAHTRWATHGEPTTRNAHPHVDASNEVAVVHNGIIENYMALRAKLESEGSVFTTDTDTEVLAHLIRKYYTGALEDAVATALALVEGTYGIAVVSSREPFKVVGARQGSPLVVGVGEGEYWVASDVSALLRYTKHVVYLDDGEMAVITPESYKTFTVDGRQMHKEVEQVEWELEQIEKGGHAHFMLKEIFEQPQSIQNAFRGRLLADEGTGKLGGLNMEENDLRLIDRIILIGCGTSWHSSMIGEYMLEDYARIPVEVEYASEFRYRNPIIKAGTTGFVVSQSGETIDTLAAMREARRRGAKVYGIVNVVGSTIARESDGGVYTHAGPEIGVASTKAFTSQIAALAVLTLCLGRLRGMTQEEGRTIVRALQEIPGKIESILANDGAIQEIAKAYAHHNNFLYLGRGYNFPVALEGALKLKEISYIHAEGYPAAEMKHGPIALIDEQMPVVFICIQDSAYDKVLSNMEEVRARKGKIIAVASEGDEQVRQKADHVIYVPRTESMLYPILTVVPLQLLAYHIAVLRNCDVDQPRNLAKSVTVE
jgi:glucosamine--fructose-6-phosphate aminotransferase (isomerizing)